MEHDGKIYMNKTDKCEIFNKFFTSHCNIDTSNSSLPVNDPGQIKLSEMFIKELPRRFRCN